MSDIGPIPPKPIEQQPFGAAPPSMKEELVSEVEQIYKNVLFATNPDIPEHTERLANISESTSTILWTCKNWDIDPQTENEALSKAISLRTDMNWGNIEKELNSIVDFLKSVDKKVGIIHKLMIAERQFCLTPQQDQPVIDPEVFESATTQIINSLKQAMTTFEVTTLENHINSINKGLQNNPKEALKLFSELQSLADRNIS